MNPADGAPQLLGRLTITLPAGFGVGAQVGSRGGGLVLCSPGQFAVGSALPSNCPAGSRIGSARLSAANLGEALAGAIYLGVPTVAGGLPTLGLDLGTTGADYPYPGRAKYVGGLTADPSGRLHVTFNEIPLPAFEELELELDGGPAALLVTPRSCGAAAGLATFSLAAGGATGSAAGATTIGPDCAPNQISPSLTVSADTPTAGAVSTMRGTFTVPDRGPAVEAIDVRLPPGLLAHIGEVAECALDAASSGQCGQDSRIGRIDLVVGAGPQPIGVSGPLHIVPRGPGAVAGMIGIVDVRIGELDLGRLMLSGQFILRPSDAGLDLQMSLPASFAGLGMHLRSAELVIDRPGFAINPSTCGPLGYGGVVTGAGGAVGTVGGSISYVGCGVLAFAPTLTAELGGETGPLGHPNVTVGLNARPGDSNLQGATVTLPRGIAADPANIQKSCPQQAFNAAACSAEARVGQATARVALTPEPIPGDVYLVRIEGQQLPGLGLSFTGRYAQRVLSTVEIGPESRLVVRFGAIPDLPLRRLDLTIIGGPKGPIRIAGGTCRAGGVWDAAFQGQGGQVSSHTIPAPCPPRAAKRAAVTLSSSRGLTVRLSDLGGRTLHSMKVTLPAGYSVNRTRAANRRFRSLAVNGGPARIKTTARTVQVFTQSKSTTRINLRLGAGTVRRAARLGTGRRKVTVIIRIAFTDGSVQRQRITLRAT